MTGAKRNAPGPTQKSRPGKKALQKRPALTHFLCLPLVNATSLPQLERSIASFNESHMPTPVAGIPQSRDKSADRPPPGTLVPLIPDGAFRPLGTLHLTIGVMNLSTKERLDEALAFFRSLDLGALMREAGCVAIELRQKQSSSKHRPKVPASFDNSTHDSEHSDILNVSLESLHAFPRPKSATVLHASPVDPTGRLHPFCVMLRDKFIEAGFILAEDKDKKSQAKEGKPDSTNPGDTQPPSGQNAIRKSSREAASTQNTSSSAAADQSQQSEMSPYAMALARKPKPRPLVLHATLVNTIYVRGRKPEGPKRIEFDARSILSKYRDYYEDESRTTPREHTTSDLVEQASEGGEEVKNSKVQFPFIWAKDIPIDSVCICEMGAKKLDLGDAALADPASVAWNARLGEKYTVISERRI
ncbi:hypothetical protein N7532_008854 [Penicillium argentinense]|uniref:A-kinase anchor protein 7-like phosphoesterase domain-containing protein n=1 Tax=Penicillium argentinense TaxID=1131581 RepID=A0A9W9EYH0_9EURO|nr:uncharacterized protein N7532_008854 [Penicillium argentinense]KAJ5090170.1 hypothetical protein N7532_008854 [Penicillium argentinense]